MPRLNLRSIPLPTDLREDELQTLARESGFACRIDGAARRSGRPHILLFRKAVSRDVPVATFSRSSSAIAWLEQEQIEAKAWASRKERA